ncbi:MAG: AAA family ATPase [Mycobacteriales bacterium]
MTLSVIRSVGTLDRTGGVQTTLARIDAETFDELDVVRPVDLDECEVDVDVLIIGAKELTTTGLRRVARWRRDHPVSVAIAHLNGTAADKTELAGAGIAQAVRGPLTVAKLRAALDRADATLWDLLDAAERHGFADSTATELDDAPGAYEDDDYAEYADEAAADVGEADYELEDDDSEYEEPDAESVVGDAAFAAAELTDISTGVTSAANRFTGVIRGVIAEVTGAANATSHHSPVALQDEPDWDAAVAHRSSARPVLVPAQPVVAHDDLAAYDDEYDETEYPDDETYQAGGYDDADNDDLEFDDLDAEGDVELDQAGADSPATPHGDYDGRIVTIASATGGCGKTFFATSTATVLARMGHRVLLVDLDLQFGEVAAALQVHHPYSIYDGLYRANGQRLDEAEFETHLPELLCHHALGFDVLAAPRDPALADYVGARDAGVVLDAVAPQYDVVIVDTPPSLNDVVIAALDRSDVVEVLATPDVPSLRNLTAFTDVLRRLGLEDERLRLVLNKVESDVGVTVAQANEAFGGRFRTTLPADRAVSRAVNRGTTAPAHEPRSKIAKAIVPAAAEMAANLALTPRTPGHPGSSPDPARPPLRRLLRAISGGNS